MTEKRVVYEQCGLRLRSEIELALPRSQVDGWDVDVRSGPDIVDSRTPPPGEVIAVCETPEGAWYTATSTDAGYRLRFSDCGEFVISQDLSVVEIRRSPSERAAIIPVLMAGTVLAFLLTLRGETVLHASAVSVDGRALAFTGHSGGGKSTVAAILCVDGYELITDDVLTVKPGPPATCVGGAPELRLRATAAAIVESRPDRTRTTEDDRVAYAARRAPAGPFPLAGIVVPAPSRSAASVEVERLEPSAALVGLLALPRVYGWRRPEVLSRDFTVLGQIANQVPVYNVTIPWGPPFSPSITPALAALAEPG